MRASSERYGHLYEMAYFKMDFDYIGAPFVKGTTYSITLCFSMLIQQMNTSYTGFVCVQEKRWFIQGGFKNNNILPLIQPIQNMQQAHSIYQSILLNWSRSHKAHDTFTIGSLCTIACNITCMQE